VLVGLGGVDLLPPAPVVFVLVKLVVLAVTVVVLEYGFEVDRTPDEVVPFEEPVVLMVPFAVAEKLLHRFVPTV